MSQVLQALFSIEQEGFSESELQNLRETLQQRATDQQLEQIGEYCQQERAQQFQQLLIGSQFAGRYLCEKPEQFCQLIEHQLAEQDFGQALAQNWFKLPTELDDQQWDAQLRQRRNLAMCAIIWRDFNRLTSTQSTCLALSHLAEAAIQTSLERHYRQLCQEMGCPKDQNQQDQGMLILGMGKLGAWELNLSSDVDLIFAYPNTGQTEGGRRSYANQEFFTRLGQRIIQSLDKLTQDGFVFRVDMRLRPYGQSGALVSSFDALEDYYQTQGREWERFAMIKARVVAHNAQAEQAQELMQILRSFTYRGYVDYSAIEALRNLKQLINRENKRRKLGDNVKLGPGGIREVEFIAQAFQIIRGGRDTELQDRRLLTILPMLEELQCLPPGIAQQLAQAYCFLRDVEHAIQGFDDQQSQNLPEDPARQQRLAKVMAHDDWPSFYQQLQQQREFVNQQFAAVIADPEDSEEQNSQWSQWQDAWDLIQQTDDQEYKDKAIELLGSLGFEPSQQAPKIQQLLHELMAAPAVVAMHSLGRERMDELMPRLLQCLAEDENPSQTLERLCKLLTAIARRSAYVLLLIENPGALKQLVKLSAASPWIANRLVEQPALLDELLNPSVLYSIPSKADLSQELRRHVLRIAPDDLEAQMEALRYFRSAHALQVAACEISERLPLMKVSDYLTELAEVILSYVLDLAWQQMLARHGHPQASSDGGVSASDPQFIVVAYGKMGGIELAHGSDLDLVFIHDADPNAYTSGDAEGQRSIDNTTFYMRLGQKIIHILNTQTLAGQLYEVDMRLRPSGNSGLLVASFSAFEKYQFNSAWTWEHQALVRARAIAGDGDLMQRFEQLRTQVLCQEREPKKLQQDVIEMREKMRSHLGSSNREQDQGLFHIKQDKGGIVDIEFMVQYAVLAWAQQFPALTRYTDNIRILGELLETGQLEAQEVQLLIEAYKAFRSMGHRLALQQQPGVVDGQLVEQERQAVTQIWRKLLQPHKQP